MHRQRMLAPVALLFASLACFSQAAPADDPPSAEELMSKSVEAMGGEEAIEKIKTLRAVMRMEAQGQEIELETLWSRDGGRLVKSSTPQGEMTLGTDGEIAWMKTPMGYQLLPESQEQALQQQAGLFMHMLEPKRVLKERNASVETVGRDTFAGYEAHKVRYVEDGGEESFIYYDVEDHLPLGFESTQETPTGGQMTERTLVSDWKKEKDVLFFRTIAFEHSAQPQAAGKMTVEELEVNTLDESSFTAPDEVKELAATPPSESSGEEISLDDLTPEQRGQALQMLQQFKASGDVDDLKRMVAQLESILGLAPEDQKPMMLYVIQELKAEIKRLGG